MEGELLLENMMKDRKAGAMPGSGSTYLAIWVLIAMVIALTLTSLLMPIDKVIASKTGKIVSAEQLTVLQALDPSIIRTLDVKEGDAVTKGQQLATLDEALTLADVRQLQSQVAGLRAVVARTEAETQQRPFEPPATAGDATASYLALEKTLYDRRAAEYSASVLSFDEKIKLQQATISKLIADVGSYNEREKLALHVQDMKNDLFKNGAGSRLDLLTATDSQLEMQRTAEFDEKALTEARHAVSSLEADRAAYIHKWLGDTTQEMVTARNNLDLAVSQLAKAAKHQELVHVTAAEPGVVLTLLSKVSVGSVLQQGDTLMTIMPLGTPVEAEVEISTRDIGFVRVGDRARIKVEAFESSQHGYAEGKVIWISPDSFTTDGIDQSEHAYYKARVSIEVLHFTGVPKSFRLIPGMTLSADINVGSQLLGRYIFELGSLLLTEAMREP